MVERLHPQRDRLTGSVHQAQAGRRFDDADARHRRGGSLRSGAHRATSPKFALTRWRTAISPVAARFDAEPYARRRSASVGESEIDVVRRGAGARMAGAGAGAGADRMSCG